MQPGWSNDELSQKRLTGGLFFLQACSSSSPHHPHLCPTLGPGRPPPAPLGSFISRRLHQNLLAGGDSPHARATRGADTHQLLKSRLIYVTLQGEVAQYFPRGLVALHLHWVGLQATVVPLGTGGHHGGSCHPLDIL